MLFVPGSLERGQSGLPSYKGSKWGHEGRAIRVLFLPEIKALGEGPLVALGGSTTTHLASDSRASI